MNKTDVNYIYNELFEEDTRLSYSKAASIEFLTNKKYILRELQENDKILELGAATGAYTMMLADHGYDVTALEYVEKNLSILKSKIKQSHKVTPVLGDAKDLSQFEDNMFDVVLNMGPLYHFPKHKDRVEVVKESLRVLKKGGTAFFAFINNDMVFVTESLMYSDKFIGNKSNVYNEDTFKIEDKPFTVLTIETIRDLMNQFDLEEYKFIASDGYAELLAPQINTLSEENFKKWLQYHYYTCEKKESLNASHHLLYITKKP